MKAKLELHLDVHSDVDDVVVLSFIPEGGTRKKVEVWGAAPGGWVDSQRLADALRLLANELDPDCLERQITLKLAVAKAAGLTLEDLLNEGE